MSQEEREAAVLASVPKQLCIGGKWVDAEGAATFEVLDPATGEVLCEVADASPADGMQALEAAVAAQADFAALPPQARADMLTRAFDLLHERIDDLALLMTLEMGKPVAEARGEMEGLLRVLTRLSHSAHRPATRLCRPAGRAPFAPHKLASSPG